LGKSILWFVSTQVLVQGLLTLSLSSTIIQDIEAMCEAGNASIIYFYFDFWDANKQDLDDLQCWTAKVNKFPSARTRIFLEK